VVGLWVHLMAVVMVCQMVDGKVAWSVVQMVVQEVAWLVERMVDMWVL
jgi:hypothetical protein